MADKGKPTTSGAILFFAGLAVMVAALVWLRDSRLLVPVLAVGALAIIGSVARLK